MADKQKNILLKINATDSASGVISKVSKTSKSAASSMNIDFKGVAIAAAAATASIAGIVYAMTKMATRAGQMQGITKGFERNFGDATKSLDRLREAAQGTISDFDLMSSSNKAALLGVTSNVSDLAGLMITARLRARELGIDATQAFDDIVTGIGRQSPLILDNLGIKVPDAIKQTMMGMDAAQQSQVLLSYAIEDGANLASQYGDIQLTSADKVAILKARIDNLKDDTLTKLIPVLEPVIEKMGNFVSRLGDATQEMMTGTTPQSIALREALSNEKTGLEPAIDRVGLAWGNLVNTLTGENNTPLENFETMLVGWALILGKIADGITAIIFAITDLIKKQKELDDFRKSRNTNEGGFLGDAVRGLGFIYGTGGVVGKRATGGISSQMTLVGENGPEMVKLPSGSHVYNNEDSKNMMGNGGITININAPTYGINDLKSSILDAVNEATARQNRLANYNLL